MIQQFCFWKVKVLVALSCLTLCNPMDCTPGSFAHGIFPGKDTGMVCHFLLQGIFPTQGLNLGLLCHFLLQGIFPTQGLNLGLLQCRQILDWLSFAFGDIFKRSIVLKTYSHIHVHSSTIHNTQAMKITHMSTNGWMNKENYTTKYYLALKEILPHITKWINLEDVKLSLT